MRVSIRSPLLHTRRLPHHPHPSLQLQTAQLALSTSNATGLWMMARHARIKRFTAARIMFNATRRDFHSTQSTVQRSKLAKQHTTDVHGGVYSFLVGSTTTLKRTRPCKRHRLTDVASAVGWPSSKLVSPRRGSGQAEMNREELDPRRGNLQILAKCAQLLGEL